MARASAKVRGVFPRDGVYWIRWACPHGHLHREKVGPKGLARQEYEKRKVRARTEGYCPRRVAAPKPIAVSEAVKDFLAYAQANKRSHADDRRRAVRITADFGNRLLDDVTPKDVEDWKVRLAEEGEPEHRREPTTVNRYLALLKTVYSMAVRNRKAKDNPVKGVRLFPENNARVRYLTDDEETALMAVLPTSYGQWSGLPSWASAVGSCSGSSGSGSTSAAAP